jgi:CHAT domain-containing protein/tetratricopeptide (TPR) repeat protein
MRLSIILLVLLCPVSLSAQKWERIDQKFHEYLDAGEYFKAGKEAARQVNWSHENLDSTDLRYMVSYYNLALAYHGMENLDQAKLYLGTAYNLMVPFYSTHGNVFADVCELYGRIETRLGYHETAYNFLTYARDVNVAVHGKESFKYMKSLYYIADLEMARSGWEETVRVLEEALQIHEQHFEKNNDYARYANFLGLIFMNNGLNQQAAENFERALSVYRDPELEKGFPFAHANNNLALCYYYLNDFGKAARHFTLADSAYQLLLDGYSENYLMLLNNLASLFYSWGKTDQARDAYLKLEQYLKGYPDAGSLIFIQAVENSANYYAEVGELKVSERYYKKAIDLRAEADPYEAREHAGGILLLASLYAEKERPDLAAETAVEACRILAGECLPGDPDLVLALSITGLNYYNAGLYNKSMYYYRMAKDQIELMVDSVPVEAASVYNNLGMLYYNQNMLREAIPCLEQAHKLDPDDPVTLTNLGMLYFDLENHPLARSMFDLARKAYGRKFGPDHPEYARSMLNLVGMKVRFRDFSDEMLEEIREVERICMENRVDSTSMLFIECLGLYRSYYYGIRDYHTSIAYASRVLDLVEKVYGHHSEYYASNLLVLSDNYKMLGDRVNFSRVFDRALDIASSLEGKQREDLLYNLETRKSFGYYYLEEYETSRNSLEWLIERDKLNYLKLQNILSLQERANLSAKLTNLVEYNNYLVHFPDDGSVISNALDNRLFLRSILMDSEIRQREELESSGDTILLKLNETYVDEKRKLTNLRSQFGMDKQVLDSMELEITRMEKEISRRLGEVMDPEERSVHWEMIRDVLGEDEAAVEVIQYYHTTPPPEVALHPWYIAFIITGEMEESPMYLSLFDALEIIPDYESYRGSVESPSGGTMGENLYENLWSEIDQALEGKKTIYFSPDGIFNLINVEALTDREGRYILDKYEIRHVASLTELLHRDREYGHNQRALLAGDPAFRMSLTGIPDPVPEETSRGAGELQSRMFPGARLSGLPGTRTEVDSIGYLLESAGWECTMLTGESATEDAVVSAISPRVLHLATHGFFARDEPPSGDSASGGNNRKYDYLNREADARSCLFFAGAQNTLYYAYDYQEGTGDGILTAWEIMDMELDSTELVVLSACETGLGQILNSEGVTGLRRAFHLAGAKRIMLSLWEVDDQATQRLMREFYENWLSGMNMDQSLANAKRSLMRDERYNHPRYWAGFILTGI